MLESSQCHSNSWEQLFVCVDNYSIARTLICSYGQLCVHTDNYMFAGTDNCENEQLSGPENIKLFGQPNNNPWKRIIIHGNEWIVRTKEHLSVPKDSCSFPRIIVRWHEQLSVRTVSSEVNSVHVPVGLRTTNYNISVSFISSHFSLHFMSDKSWHCIHSYIPTRLIR